MPRFGINGHPDGVRAVVCRDAGSYSLAGVNGLAERGAVLRRVLRRHRSDAHVVEPFFGHLKGPLNLRRLLMRGLSGATTQYLLACTAHNMMKLAPHWSSFQAASV